MTTMVEIWNSLLDWASTNAPHLLETLIFDVSDQQIDRSKDIVGYQDSQLWSLYQVTGGNRFVGLTFPIPGLQILPLPELVREVKNWRILSIEQDPDDVFGGQGGVEVMQRGLARAEYAHWDHVPFAADGTGNYLALDFAPGLLGTIGQVINIGAGEDNRYVIAQDLVSLFEFIFKLLKDKSIAVNPDDKSGILYCFDPSRYLFLDALPILRQLNLLADPDQ